MKLIADDHKQVYYWTDDRDTELSPHFDYEEDAHMWKEQMKSEICNCGEDNE